MKQIKDLTPPPYINVTPLIDVLLVMLIIFMAWLRRSIRRASWPRFRRRRIRILIVSRPIRSRLSLRSSRIGV